MYLHCIETEVPPGVVPQAAFAEFQQQLLADEKLRRCTEYIYEDCGIETRHSVVVEPGSGLQSAFYGLGATGLLPRSTRERNDLFIRQAGPLAAAAGAKALRASGFTPRDITHLITVSCTGCCNPGPDLAVALELGLPRCIQRYQLGFMGCSAALPALRMAQQFCRAAPEAIVLIICVELCSLHLHDYQDLDTILGNALFADGAAAAIVSSQPAGAAARIESFCSIVLPEGADDMAWRVGDQGFDLVLSRYVPRIIGANIGRLVETLLAPHGAGRIDAWAVHPGGKSILDKVQEALHLDPLQLEASRGILRRYGNMSSATVLFVLEEILRRAAAGARVCALAFAPGLSVEAALLERI